jgi:hypothetical protein
VLFANLLTFRPHIVETAVAQFAIVGVTPHSKIDAAIRRVGVALANQSLDDLNNAGYFLRSPRIHMRPLNIEGIHIGEIALDEASGQLLR